MSEAVSPKGDKPDSSRIERIPPSALDVEMAVLGAMMLDQEAASRVYEILDDSCFYKDAHKTIFQATLKLYQRNDPIDLVTVTEVLNADNKLDEVGGGAYLAELTGMVASPANAEHHARIVLRKSLLRKMIHTCTRTIDKCYSEPDEVNELLDSAENEIFQLMQFGKAGGFRKLGPLMVSVQGQLENLRSFEGGVTGVPSGFKDLDEKTSGWQPGDMIILAGRPSMGKTALALNFARNAAVEFKIPVGFFSLEMADHQLALRLMCSEVGVDSKLARTGKLGKEYNKLLKNNVLFDAPFFIDDTPALSPMEIRARARRLKSEHDIGLILVDYIGLMEMPGRRIESQQQKIADISRSLKALAKDLKVPIIILSQLSRAVETRPGDKRPILSDLRDSGAIEQDADVVLFIYRPGLYAEKSDSSDTGESYTEVIVAKQRNGPLGTAKLHFNLQSGRFESLDAMHEPPVFDPMMSDTPPF
jgi:replicative DNA helicase